MVQLLRVKTEVAKKKERKETAVSYKCLSCIYSKLMYNVTTKLPSHVICTQIHIVFSIVLLLHKFSQTCYELWWLLYALCLEFACNWRMLLTHPGLPYQLCLWNSIGFLFWEFLTTFQYVFAIYCMNELGWTRSEKCWALPGLDLTNFFVFSFMKSHLVG